MADRIAIAFEILDHGIENSQYFQGCGTAFTEYTMVATGIGDNYTEALDDALESLAQAGWNVDIVVPEEHAGNGRSVSDLRRDDDEIDEDEESEDDEVDDERYYHVSVRVREYDPEKDEPEMEKAAEAIGRLADLAIEIHNAQTPSGDANLLPALREERVGLEAFLNEMEITLNDDSLLQR